MEQKINDRIRLIIKCESVTVKDLGDVIGFAKGTLSNMFSRGTNPSYEMIFKIAENFPDYSMDWLITGKGDVYKSDAKRRDDVIGGDDDSEAIVDLDLINCLGENKMLKQKNEYLEARIKDLEIINETQMKTIETMQTFIDALTKNA